MTYLQRALQNKEYELEKLLEKLHTLDTESPSGSLDVHPYGSSYQYYRRTVAEPGEPSRRIYIQNKDREIARQLAQNSYNHAVDQAIRQEIEGVRRLKRIYIPDEIDQLYSGMCEGRRKIVTPVRIPREEQIAQWESTHTGEQNPYPNSTDLYSERKEHVRSKSEKILADKFLLMGIPYRYEPALILTMPGSDKPVACIYPDFILLNKRTGREYYWEHFGRMGEPEYTEDFVKKMELYEKCGIFPGGSLITTFETADHALNMNVVEKMIQKYLL